MWERCKRIKMLLVLLVIAGLLNACASQKLPYETPAPLVVVKQIPGAAQYAYETQ